MTKVLHFAQSLPGGPASYLEEIIPAQVAAFGPENVRLLLPVSTLDHLPSIARDLIVSFSQEGRGAASLLGLAGAFKSAVGAFKPDILHLHSSYAGAIGRLPFLFKTDRPKIVYCSHGWAFTMAGHPLKQNAYALIERVLAHQTDAIVNISEFEFREALRRGISRDKMTVILNGIASMPPTTGPRNLELGADRINLVFAGRHDRQKGLDIALAAMRQIEDCSIHLHVLGAPVVQKGSPPTHASRPNVTFYGWQKRTAVMSFLLEADALLMPSRWEGFGLSAVEAMRAGKAVIASDQGALSEIVLTNETGLIFPLSAGPERLADILRNTSRPALADMGRKGRTRFLARFTAERMNNELMALYGRLTGCPKR